jgi:thiamine biosynthesis protein ThiS
MKIKLNGEMYEAGTASNVLELLEALGIPLPALLVEHNGLALRREEWSERALAEGDWVEMIRIVAGG